MSATRLKRYGPGVVLYRNDRREENGATNLVIHYLADPEKREPAWPETESRIVGGVGSIDWRQEQEIDFDAEAGLLTYWAWDAIRNVVPAFPIPINWRKWIAVDFGGTVPSCVLFLAQDPETLQVVVWAEIYRAKTSTNALKQECYDILALAMGVTPEALRIEDVLEDGVGDPKRRQDIIDWNTEPWPIPLRGNPRGGGVDLNARKAGENRVNDWLAPSFVCCARRQVIRDLGVVMTCRRCGKEREGRPLLVVQTGRAPNLVRTIPEVIRKPSTLPGIEAPEDDLRGIELHAVDALRYACMAWTIEDPAEKQEPDILSVPSWRLSGDDVLRKVRAHAIAQRERARLERDLEGDDSVLVSTDPLVALEESMGLGEEDLLDA